MDLYKESARIVSKLSRQSESKSPKVLIYNSEITNKKVLMALTCGYMKYSESMNALAYRCTMLHSGPPVHGNDYLLRVLLYEHVIGEGVISGPTYGHYRKMLLQNSEFIIDQWERLKRKKKVTKNEDMMNDAFLSPLPQPQPSLPRWVRINTLLTTVDQVVSRLTRAGYDLLEPVYKDYTGFVKIVRELDAHQFMRDYSLPDVLVMATGTELHDHDLTNDGHILLQDKASCIPAHVLCPSPESHVIDCCAAPGNKTSHLAAIMGDNGRIFAFDRDEVRYETMKRLLNKAGVTSCTTVNCDFLNVRTSDSRYENVEYILVDPSCSGSGIVNRIQTSQDRSTTDCDSSPRIQKLSNIQTMLLKHALSFPAVKRVVYSTCSVNTQENEAVVAEALEKFSSRFHLVEILPELSRGNVSYDCSKFCVRMKPDLDSTNGFFVACFERNSTETSTNGKGKKFRVKFAVSENLDGDDERKFVAMLEPDRTKIMKNSVEKYETNTRKKHKRQKRQR